MQAKLLDGRMVAQTILQQLSSQVESHKLKPVLEVIQLGKHPKESLLEDYCNRIGVRLIHTQLPEQSPALQAIRAVRCSTADGIVVQLPKYMEYHPAIGSVPPTKDVGCVRNVNRGNLFTDDGVFSPVVPLAIMELLWEHCIELVGKHCVILGRGDSIGKPLAVMFMNVGATVTVCNSHTTDLKAITTQADILVSTIRRPGVITADMLHPGAVVVDLGDNLEEIGQVAGCVSPAVGGVDVITPAVLIQNTVLACEMYSQK